MQSTLVLNASFEPLTIVSIHRAVSMLTSGKAFSVDDSSRVMRAATCEIPVPYVIQLTYYINRKHNNRSTYSRHGVMVRDSYSCVYCGRTATTIDHVVPRSKGGKTTYDNCVAACSRCNLKKSDRTLKEIGWVLHRKPIAPSQYLLILHKAPVGSAQHESWKQYLLLFEPQLVTV